MTDQDQVALLAAALEISPLNTMIANRDLEITYLNPASVETLRTIEHLLPVKADQMVGANIDIFHKQPSYQRDILSSEKNLPRKTHIQVGDQILDLAVKPVQVQGEWVGSVATWSVITEQVRLTELVTTASAELGANINAVAAAAEEMTASINEIARNATTASQVADQASTKVEGTRETTAKLVEAAAEISDVLKVITSIAQQTNMLALNATIEAARAGEAGKGFAVVANEVKDLAKETGEATERIASMIQEIQASSKETSEAVASIGTVIQEVNAVSATIAAAVEQQSATTQEIARSISEAAVGASQMGEAIQEVIKG